MKSHHKFLTKATGHSAEKAISDAQLRRIFRHLDWVEFNEIMEKYFSISITQIGDNEWVAVDGKELRGSIVTLENGEKEKRGTTLLDVVSHAGELVVSQTFFEGTKDSERVAVVEIIETKLLGHKITLDALHSIPNTLSVISENEGTYLVQVKGNQKELYEDLVEMPRYQPLLYTTQSTEKGHGRIDYRLYTCYDIQKEYFDERWTTANIKTLVKVERQSTKIKGGKVSNEVSYYVSNQAISSKTPKVSSELCGAVRNHWHVENHHQIRDVTLGEDKVRTPQGNATKILAVLRSWVINLYRRQKTVNFAQAIEETRDNQNIIFKLFKIKQLRT
jgi:predicted transposase YbfD/YdcC